MRLIANRLIESLGPQETSKVGELKTLDSYIGNDYSAVLAWYYTSTRYMRHSNSMFFLQANWDASVIFQLSKITVVCIYCFHMEHLAYLFLRKGRRDAVVVRV